MGGKALTVQTERKSTKDFLRIYDEVTSVLDKYGVTYHLVKCYHTKPDHGDLDLLVAKNHEIDFSEIIDVEFKPRSVNPNGDCISFDYDNFQVDFIKVSEKYFDAAKFYFDYDPFGNLSGKIAHKFGLKFGFDGLVLPIRLCNGRITENIVISIDRRRIIEFLGMDYDKYMKGFETVEEIFEFIIDSKYFNVEMFQMDNLTRIDRKRNKKRNSFQYFLRYLDENKIQSKHQFEKVKSDYLDDIDAFFPEACLKHKIELINQKADKINQAKEKFNAFHIMNMYPQLKGEELGFVIDKFKNSFDDYLQMCIDNTNEEIINKFKIFYESRNR